MGVQGPGIAGRPRSVSAKSCGSLGHAPAPAGYSRAEARAQELEEMASKKDREIESFKTGRGGHRRAVLRVAAHALPAAQCVSHDDTLTLSQ